jgi:flagellar biosynthesis/type III secretory pathway chaperone
MSLENIIGSFSINFKFQEEFLMMTTLIKELADSTLKDFEIFQVVKEEKDELEGVVKELSDITLGIQDRKDKFIKILKDKNLRMDFELKQATFSRDKFKSDLEDLSKKYSDLQEEHQKLRTRIKKFKKAFSEDIWEEKYCKNCQKPYKDSKNFNWSCKRHASAFNDDRYWCCGQTEKDSEGCITSKHVSSDDVAEEEQTKDDSVIFCSVRFK